MVFKSQLKKMRQKKAEEQKQILLQQQLNSLSQQQDILNQTNPQQPTQPI